MEISTLSSLTKTSTCVQQSKLYLSIYDYIRRFANENDVNMVYMSFK